MCAQYQRLYANGNVVAYGRSDGPYDHLFVWAAAAGPLNFASLNDLLNTWSTAPKMSGVTQRSIFFCQEFDPATLSAALNGMSSADLQNCWDLCAYWSQPVFTGIAGDRQFPSGNSQVVLIGDIYLYLPLAAAPQSLADFTIVCDANEQNLLLTLKAAPSAVWSLDGVESPPDSSGRTSISIQLLGAQFVAGGIGLSIPWASGTNDAHPMQRTRFVYAAAPVPPPQPGDLPAQCRWWTTKFSDKVMGSSCQILLDPRDATSNQNWCNGELNSHLHFGDAVVHSSFFSPCGDRFQLTSGDGAAARLGFLYDTINSAGTVTTSAGKVLFHPEGSFGIQSPAEPAATPLNISPRDLLAGSASTEFFATSQAKSLEFVRGQPAFFIEGETGSPSGRTLLDPKVFTSYISFEDAANPVDFHTQPSESPLFEAAAPGPLGRRRQRFGPSPFPLPVFPFAGYDVGPIDEDILRFDSTHLALKRRNIVKPPTPAVALAAAVPTRPPTTRAVTPQGLLADVTADGDYVQIYFGNPDSQAVKEDFSITLTDPGVGTIYRELQHALAGNQLFVVLRNNLNADSIVPKVVGVAANLYLNDFVFSIGREGGGTAPASGAPADTPNTSYMSASALLVKFYTGKSLDDLVKDTRLWVCQTDLAPSGNSDFSSGPNAWNPFLGGVTPDLQALQSIWMDPNWQGVLALNFAIPVLPDLLEALRPGLSSPRGSDGQPTDPVLRAHHFGLNAVPIRQTDVAPSAPSPTRFCSAFGLVKYDYDATLPPQVPEGNDAAPGVGPTGAAYSFIVKHLQITFDKSQISNFSATVDVGFTHMFWDQIDRGGAASTITLVGSYESRPQQAGSPPQDVFSLTTNQLYSLTFGQGFIDSLAITRAQLTVSPVDNTDPNRTLNASILFDATIKLREASALSLFTVNYVRLSSFGFQFRYQRTSPPMFSFKFSAGGISADIDFDPGTVAGNLVHSVLSLLPVTLKGMMIAIDKLIDIDADLHFTPVGFGGVGKEIHFGFLMEVDLGSLGQLAGSLNSLRLPLLMGWRAAGPGSPGGGVAFGIHFPKFNGRIDIGIQQFIRLRADTLNLDQCSAADGSLTAIAIQLGGARIVMFGEEWPDQNIYIVVFLPVNSGRKVSWAFGIGSSDDDWYVGGGYRIASPSVAIDTKQVVSDFVANLSGITPGNECTMLPRLNSSSDNWAVVGQYQGDGAFNVGVAVYDPKVYGVDISISDFDLDLLYQRVNDQLGIFSVELALPLDERTFQFGAATVRLPVFRMELHTDGGYLIDFGFPWNNDYSRAAQVEVYIFLGSGGFYYGNTSSAADPRLSFDGGYGFATLDDSDSAITNPIRDIRVGYASRGGIGRSFTCGILYAEASLTLFGSLEGSSAYYSPARQTGQIGQLGSIFHPVVFAISGTMGLMLDIQITVNFSIIQASAHILAYVDFGIAFKRVLAKKARPGTPGVYDYFRLTLPVIISTNVSLSVRLDVNIHIGCVDITIHLHFSATWHVQFTLGDLGIESYSPPQFGATGIPYHQLWARKVRVLSSAGKVATITWDPDYAYWSSPQKLNVYATVLGCLSDAAVNAAGNLAAHPAAVGAMLLPVNDLNNGFGDLAQFLAGWALLQGTTLSGNPNDYANFPVTLGHVIDVQNLLSPGPNPYIPDPNNPTPPPSPDAIWFTFPAGLLNAVGKQFVPQLKLLPDNTGNAPDIVPYAIIPLWPGSSFNSAPLPFGSPAVSVTPASVTELRTTMPADQAVFVEYCRHMMVELILEIRQMIEASATDPHDPNTTMKWMDIWTNMFNPPKA